MKTTSSLKFKNKIKRYMAEGYPQKQAVAMTYSHFRKNPSQYSKNNSPVGKCIFHSPDEMREFLNKHLGDKWSWKKNKIVIHTGQDNWPIARKVEEFLFKAGFPGSGSEMDEIGNIYVSAFIPKSILAHKEFAKNPDKMIQLAWLRNKVSVDEADKIINYYAKKFVNAEVMWFDSISGEGMVRLNEGPLEGSSVFVHGSAFGGDMNFGQNTSFEATEELPVLVKLYIDDNNLMVDKMKLRK